MKLLKNKLGLTLIEVVIVMIVLGVLVAVLLPEVMQRYNLYWVW